MYTQQFTQSANGTIGKEIGAIGKMVIPLVPMVQMLPTNGTIGRTPNTRNVLHRRFCYFNGVSKGTLPVMDCLVRGVWTSRHLAPLPSWKR